MTEESNFCCRKKGWNQWLQSMQAKSVDPLPRETQVTDHEPSLASSSSPLVMNNTLIILNASSSPSGIAPAVSVEPDIPPLLKPRNDLKAVTNLLDFGSQTQPQAQTDAPKRAHHKQTRKFFKYPRAPDVQARLDFNRQWKTASTPTTEIPSQQGTIWITSQTMPVSNATQNYGY